MFPASEEGFVCSSEFDHPLRFCLRHCEQEQRNPGGFRDVSPSTGEESHYTNDAERVLLRVLITAIIITSAVQLCGKDKAETLREVYLLL